MLDNIKSLPPIGLKYFGKDVLALDQSLEQSVFDIIDQNQLELRNFE